MFVCSSCGASSLKWSGKCAQCSSWNTMEESAPSAAPVAAADPSSANRSGWVGVTTRPQRLREVREGAEAARMGLGAGLGELARVLGGGLVPGSLMLVGGDPGIGKSTLALQAAVELARGTGRPVLYVSGEETTAQLRMRARRLGDGGGEGEENLFVWNENHAESIIEAVREMRPCALVVDSVQTMHTSASPAAAGSIVQVRETAARFLRLAKSANVATLLVGHVNKSGEVAGPRMLEHLVDTVLYVEGEPVHSHRLVRTTKNRFGTTNEVAVLDMTDAGLVEVRDPGMVFLSAGASAGGGEAGSAVAATLEGTRAMMVEIQSLMTAKYGEYSRHRCNGMDADRFHLLLAVLSKHLRVPVPSHNVFANVVGGISLSEPAGDLALVAATLSSHRELPVPPMTAFAGEVGLSGEVRPVAQVERRVAEASKLGFRQIFVPAAGAGSRAAKAAAAAGKGVTVVPVGNVRELRAQLFATK